MNYKRAKALFNLLKATEIYFNFLLKEKYNEIEKILNQEINIENDSENFYIPLFFGYVINNKHILWNEENSDKISSVKKKIFEINKTLLSEFILNVFKKGYHKSCANWETLGLPDVKLQYIENKSTFINNFLYADNKQQKEFLGDIYSDLLNYLIAQEIDENKNFKNEILNINSLKNTHNSTSFDLNIYKSNIKNSKFPEEIKNLLLRLFEFIEVYHADLLANLPIMSNKILHDIFQKENEDMVNMIDIDDINNLETSFIAIRKGKLKNNWAFHYLHLPYIIAANKIKEFLILEKKPKTQKNSKIDETQLAAQPLSFQLKHGKTDILRHIIYRLSAEIYLVNEKKTKIEYLIEILTSKDLSKFTEKIFLGCETVEFQYVIGLLKSLFYNLSATSIDKSQLFLTKDNQILLKRANLYNSKIDNPKTKEIIDKIFKEKQ